MIITEDFCVGCPPELGCLGNSCPNRNVQVRVCDQCEEPEQLYRYDDKELCLECLLDYIEAEEIND